MPGAISAFPGDACTLKHTYSRAAYLLLGHLQNFQPRLGHHVTRIDVAGGRISVEVMELPKPAC